jgi:hypothetical protein
MFVLLTWVLEASSYCLADAGGCWHARPELTAKPHLAAVLPCLGGTILTGRIPEGQGCYCGGERVLRHGGSPAAPWNLALQAAAASGRRRGPGPPPRRHLCRVPGGNDRGHGGRRAPVPTRQRHPPLAYHGRLGRSFSRSLLLAHPARPVLPVIPCLVIACVYGLAPDSERLCSVVAALRD